MKKSRIILLASLMFILLGTSISNAASNNYYYYESGVWKSYKVTVSISDKSSSHAITGEAGSGPYGYGYVTYGYNGAVRSERVNGTGYDSHWTAYKTAAGRIIRASTTVTSKGLDQTVTDYQN